MKILLGNNTLSFLGGSETWTYTLACQLKSLGHHVACFSPELGVISDNLLEQGIESYSHLNNDGIRQFDYVYSPRREHEYDVIIASHFHIVRILRARFPKTPIISTIHGIIHYLDNGKNDWAPEHPATDAGVNEFIAVSEEVKDLLRSEYNIEARIIRNFFDVKKFAEILAPHKTPQQFLINTNYAGTDDPVVELIRQTAKLMDARVGAIGYNFSPNFRVEIPIRDSDVVFGMGRSVLEGVAAGRLGIVLGRWGFGGVIKESTINDIRYKNFSGRNDKTEELPSPDELKKMIEENYQSSVLEWGKQYVAREHNVALAADEFIRIARDLNGDNINKNIKVAAVHPEAKPLKRAYEN